MPTASPIWSEERKTKTEPEEDRDRQCTEIKDLNFESLIYSFFLQILVINLQFLITNISHYFTVSCFSRFAAELPKKTRKRENYSC